MEATIGKWFSAEYFETTLDSSKPLYGLRKAMSAREIHLTALKTSKTPYSLRSRIFLWRLIAKTKIQKKILRSKNNQIEGLEKDLSDKNFEILKLSFRISRLESELTLVKESRDLLKAIRGLE